MECQALTTQEEVSIVAMEYFNLEEVSVQVSVMDTMGIMGITDIMAIMGAMATMVVAIMEDIMEDTVEDIMEEGTDTFSSSIHYSSLFHKKKPAILIYYFIFLPSFGINNRWK
jgi:hypothetical protein